MQRAMFIRDTKPTAFTCHKTEPGHLTSIFHLDISQATGQEDDTHPDCVSPRLRLGLEQSHLGLYGAPLAKGYNVQTWRALGTLDDAMIQNVCGCCLGAVVRLKDLRDKAYSEMFGGEEIRGNFQGASDAEPEYISRKLGAKLRENGLECLGGVLVQLDVRSFEGLGKFDSNEVDAVLSFALAVLSFALRPDKIVHFRALCAEAATAARGAEIAARGAEQREQERCAKDRKLQWQGFLLTSNPKLEIARAKMLSENRQWNDVTRRLDQALHALGSDTPALSDADRFQCGGLKGALRAFSIVCELAKAAKLEGWSQSECASAIRSTAPTLRDTAALRAIDLVGIGNRDAYLAVLNKGSNGEIARNANFKSQMLMAFEKLVGGLQGAFSSNSSKDARRRGKARPRRQRGGGLGAVAQEDLQRLGEDEDDDGEDCEPPDATIGERLGEDEDTDGEDPEPPDATIGGVPSDSSCWECLVESYDFDIAAWRSSMRAECPSCAAAGDDDKNNGATPEHRMLTPLMPRPDVLNRREQDAEIAAAEEIKENNVSVAHAVEKVEENKVATPSKEVVLVTRAWAPCGEEMVGSCVPLAVGDRIEIRFRDPSGWTFVDIVPLDGEVSPERKKGWVPYWFAETAHEQVRWVI